MTGTDMCAHWSRWVSWVALLQWGWLADMMAACSSTETPSSLSAKAQKSTSWTAWSRDWGQWSPVNGHCSGSTLNTPTVPKDAKDSVYRPTPTWNLTSISNHMIRYLSALIRFIALAASTTDSVKHRSGVCLSVHVFVCLSRLVCSQSDSPWATRTRPAYVSARGRIHLLNSFC